MSKKIKIIISVILLIILLPILFVSFVILINSYTKPDEIPSFFGWKPFIVLSGSMETEIFAGDIAVVKEVDLKELKENDIIAFREENVVITHRIVNIIETEDELKFITKGDNNKDNDSDYVLGENIEGKYQFKISRLGNFAMFLQTPIGLVVCLSIPILGLFVFQLIENKKEEKEKSDKENELKAEIERLKKENDELSKKEL